MKTIFASQDVRASIHAIIVGHMASALIVSKANLSDPTACRAEMIAAGFGEPSIEHLLSRSIEAAKQSLAAAASKEV